MDIHTHLKQFLTTPLGEASYKLCQKLHDAGFTAFIAGGAVRDFLLDLPVTDIDIATNALPKDIKSIFNLDSQHSEAVGSLVVRLESFTFEITTFRKDSTKSTNRKPETIEFTTMDKDVHRRDFTINGLYADIISGEVVDFTGGLNDLNERIVTSIGKPEVRFAEDPLRILRAIRLKATINGQYHPSVYASLKNSQVLLQQLTPITVWKELEKVLMSSNPSIALEDMWELDIIELFWPELAALKGIPQPQMYHKEGDVWNHTLKSCDAFTLEHSIDVRVATLLHDIGKATTFSIDKERIHFNEHASESKLLTQTIGSRFNLPKRRIEKLSFLVGHHMMMGDLLSMTEERKAHWYYHEWFIELLQLFYLDIAGTDPQNFSLYEEIVADYNSYLDKQPNKPKELLSGNEIMEILSIPESAQVKVAKDAVATAQLQKQITTKKEAIAYLKKHKHVYTKNMRQ